MSTALFFRHVFSFEKATKNAWQMLCRQTLCGFLLFSILAFGSTLSFGSTPGNAQDRPAKAQVTKGSVTKTPTTKPLAAAKKHSKKVTKNGFDLSNATIPHTKILSGGPPRDAIPAINKPKFIPINKVNFLQDSDIVIGLTRGKSSRAYPTRILIWHEIVNDVFNKEPVAVTYCPLCGTSMVFDRKYKNKVLTFGVSGLLYQSDVLMYDRETDSLWSQLAMKSVAGPNVGTKLKWLPSEHLTWKAWREKYPHGTVLSLDTGFKRNYKAQAYASYFATDRIMFPVPQTRKELANKTKVLGLIINGVAKAYPLKSLAKNKKALSETLGGKKITIQYDAISQLPTVLDTDGKNLSSVVVYWFAWQAFYPKTELHESR